MLLPVFAPLVAPFLAILPRALQLVPALVAILLEIVTSLLTLFAALIPGFVATVDAILPFAVAVLRALAPVGPLFWTGWPFARSRSVLAYATAPICERTPKSCTGAGTSGCTKKVS